MLRQRLWRPLVLTYTRNVRQCPCGGHLSRAVDQEADVERRQDAANRAAAEAGLC